MGIDICLVNMPFCNVTRPSLALGLLHALLEEGGIKTKSLYANLFFAERIGPENYIIPDKINSEEVLGEWLFVPSVFPGFAYDDAAYIRRLRERNGLLKKYREDHLGKLLKDIREEAARFSEEMVSRILDSGARIVGCTSTFQQHVASLSVLKHVHERAPDIITMMGGANCETVMGKSTHENFPWIDYVVSGEADTFMSEFCGRLLDLGRELKKEDLPQGVFGPVHRLEGYPANQGLRWNTWRATTESLEELPIPNYDDYFTTLDGFPELRETVRPGLLFETSRGCWWKERCGGCTFCGLNGAGKQFRRKSPGKILNELDLLSEKYGAEGFEATDNVMDMAFCQTLLPALKKERKYHLFFETRSTLQKKQVKMLADSGTLWIQPGIESLHTKMLTLMNKGCKAYHNIQFLKWCRLFGVRTSWSILYGFPKEEERWYGEMAALVPLLTHLQPPSSMIRVRFHRYSEFHLRPEAFGLELVPFDSYRYVYPLSEDKLADQVYFFDVKDRPSKDSVFVLSILLGQSGYKEMAGALNTWYRLFWQPETPPMLRIFNKNGKACILDTRKPDQNKEKSLSDVELAILEACDRAVSEMFLKRVIKKSGYSATETVDALEGLVKQGIVLSIDGRFLSLALDKPAADLPLVSEFPGGGLKWEEEAQDGRRVSK